MNTKNTNNYKIKIFIILLLHITLSLSGCTNKQSSPTKPRRYSQLHDTAPLKTHIPKNILRIPDATPKDEPKSRYGNPSSYVVLNKKYYVMPSSSGYKARGLASWYGTKFHGHKTSNGELYDMYKMTAAHKTLPIPTYIKVRNLENGRTVIVKVNDRGPFHGDRILDLSYAAAAKLGILGKGTGRIEITAINPKKFSPSNTLIAKKQPAKHNNIKTEKLNPKITALKQNPPIKNVNNSKAVASSKYLQVGVFSSKQNAELLKNKISNLPIGNLPVHIETCNRKNTSSIFKVKIGPINDPNKLNLIRKKIIQAKLPTPIIKPAP